MSRRLPIRDDLAAAGGYRSLQAKAPVRLNTNESPYPPPARWQEALAQAVATADFHRYPDRDARELRSQVAAAHGVSTEEVFCANGSNEVLQVLLLAFGGPGRRVLVFEPTYALHAHIARLTGTGVLAGARDEGLRVGAEAAGELIGRERPDLVFLCSPNNPTGRLETPEVVAAVVEAASGLCVVDEAYGQFASWSAMALRTDAASDGLAVVRTFSKTWAMAGARLGYVIAHPDVVDGCRLAALPYHLSVQTQLAGMLALRFADEMTERVGRIAAERERLAGALSGLDVDTWPSDANFVLFRPRHQDGGAVWKALLEDGVLVRDFSNKAGLEGCLRVTVGTPEEDDRFVDALGTILGREA